MCVTCGTLGAELSLELLSCCHRGHRSNALGREAFAAQERQLELFPIFRLQEPIRVLLSLLDCCSTKLAIFPHLSVPAYSCSNRGTENSPTINGFC
eukprot:6462123-Amphidinium_carterae.1